MSHRRLTRATTIAAVASFALLAPTAAPAQAAPPGGHDTGLETAVTRTATGGHVVTWEGSGRHFVWASTDPADPSATGTYVGSDRDGSLTVDGLSDQARWYFEVSSSQASAHSNAGTVRATIVATREVGLDATTNTRDLGGFATEDGRHVRWGLLFRSDAVTRPTARDGAVLRSIGLTQAVDFRSATEVAKDGANVYDASVVQHQVPLLDPSTTALSDAIQAVLAGGDPSAAEALLGGGRAEEIAATGPTQMMARPTTQQAFGDVLRLLSQDDGAPLIFNCTAGKDRTGVFAAVLLRVLGVPEAPVLADYELSNVYRAAANQATYAFLAKAGIDAALIEPLLEQSGANVAAMFDAIDLEFGSFDAFVRDGLGLDATTVEALRGRYLR